jgi:SSS family solute:Na+ symporter
VAGGRMGTLLAFGTYATTTYSAFMMIGLVGLSYITGVGALGFELLYLLATVILLSTIGYEIWKLSKERNWIAPSEMLGDLFNSRIMSITSAILYLIVMIPYVAAQIQGLGIIFEYGGLEYLYGVIIGVLLVYIWIYLAGMWSVASTDLYQGILMLISGFIYIGWIYNYMTEIGIKLNDVINMLGEKGYLGITSFWTFTVFLSYTLPWIFFAITNPQVVVRLYIHRNESTYKKAVIFFSIFGLLYTLLSVSIGLLARALAVKEVVPANLSRDSVTPYMLSLMPSIIGSLIGISIMAAAISTANSIVLAVSGSICREINIKSERKISILAKIINLLISIIAGVIAYYRIGFIVELSVLTSVLLLPFAPLTIIGVLLRGRVNKYTRTSGVIGLIIGVVIGLYYSMIYGPIKTFILSLYNIPLSGWILLISSAILFIGFLVDKIKEVKNRKY